MALQYQIIPVTPFEQNCSLIWCDKTKKAALVDPGGDLPKLLQKVAEQGVARYTRVTLCRDPRLDDPGLRPICLM